MVAPIDPSRKQTVITTGRSFPTVITTGRSFPTVITTGRSFPIAINRGPGGALYVSNVGVEGLPPGSARSCE